MVVFKDTVIARDSKSGNGKNLIIGGAFCYLSNDDYDNLMNNDNLDRIEVTDDVETIEGTDIKTRSVVQFVRKDMTAEEKLDQMIALQEKAKKIDPEARQTLAALGL